ncbi:beta-ketoacyl-ACP synthase, partial [bacterium]|nr:beta-ketoacyl-ACP synthase [bacterium]
MSKRVVITGMALTSPLGSTVEASFERLHFLENCVQNDEDLNIYNGLHTRLDTKVKDFAVPPDFSRKVTRSMGRVALMSVVTAKQALEDAKLIDNPIISSSKTGVSYGSCSGSIDALMDFYSMCVNHEVKNLNSGSYVRMMSHTAAVNISLYFK